MAKNSTQHYRELLITLDYLLNHTDEDHPATTINICEYARDKYGLRFDKGTLSGNDIDRRRIGKLLKYLKHFSIYNEVPFLLEQTSGGKYYIEQKNFIDEEHLLKLIAAVKNDKYTQEVDTEFFEKTLPEVFGTSDVKKEEIKTNLKSLERGVKKYSRKQRVINRAFKEKKAVRLDFPIFNFEKMDNDIISKWYRVYQIKEYKNKPFALLLPISDDKYKFSKGYIFDHVENLPIPNLSDRSVLVEDDDRDLDNLFKKKAAWMTKYYSSPEQMLKANKMPIGGIAFKVSFYFKKVFLKFVKPSFENFFSTNLEYVECTRFNTLSEAEVSRKNDKFYIEPIPMSKEDRNSRDRLCVVNTFIDLDAFMSWLISDIRDDGELHASDYIEIVGPTRINTILYRFYKKHADKFYEYLSPEELQKVQLEEQRRLERKEKENK